MRQDQLISRATALQLELRANTSRLATVESTDTIHTIQQHNVAIYMELDTLEPQLARYGVNMEDVVENLPDQVAEYNPPAGKAEVAGLTQIPPMERPNEP